MKESAIFFAHRPHTINRAALIVRPRQSYVDWANSVNDDGPRADLRKLREEPRIYLVEVVDFLDFYLGSRHWPAFNVADSAITIGVIIFIFHLLFNKLPD